MSRGDDDEKDGGDAEAVAIKSVPRKTVISAFRNIVAITGRELLFLLLIIVQ